MHNLSNAEHKPYWSVHTGQKIFPKLSEDLSVDVTVIGGGITGITAALILKNAGKKVALIDRDHILFGETGNTTAHLMTMVDTRYHQLIATFGEEKAKMVEESSRAAIDIIEGFVKQYSIDCDFSYIPGYLYAAKPDQIVELSLEIAAVKQLSINAHPQPDLDLPLKTYGALAFANQGQIHPKKYISALASHIPGDGSYIFEETKVLGLEENTKGATVTTEQGKIRCKHVIEATHSPAFDSNAIITKIAPYRTYALAGRFTGKHLPSGLFWDLSSPYYYIRPYKDLWIVGGKDHKTGTVEDSEKAFADLEEFATNALGLDSVVARWSGQVLQPVDGLPYIGLNPGSKATFIATGYSGNGMTFGTIAGMLISDIILGRDSPWSDLYSPQRYIGISSIPHYIAENKDFPLFFAKDRLSALFRDVSTDLKPGEGKVIFLKGKSVAIAKDHHGVLHSVSACCTHLGCYVHWNNAEQSWDCPCHGSRFSPDGKVLTGPATEDLEPRNEEVFH